MTFEDLPEDWSSRPITADIAADVVDLFVAVRDREAGCLSLLLMSPDGKLLQPISIDEIPPFADPDEGREMLNQLFGHLGGGLAVIATLGRRGHLRLSPRDLAWAAMLRETAASHGIDLRQVFVATANGVIEAPTMPGQRVA